MPLLRRGASKAQAFAESIVTHALLVSAVGGLLSCSRASSTPSTTPPPYAAGAPWPKFRGNAAQDGTSTVCPKKTPGATVWSVPTGRGVFSSPIVAADGTVYIGSADRTFYALSPDGGIAWTSETGEIIDSAGLLDDHGNVYFGSGDSILRALNAKTGETVWTFQADSPTVNKAFINWFEGNVALGESGDLIVPNDNWFLYDIDRTTGKVRWKHTMPDQTWSLPAVSETTGDIFIGNNNVLGALGDNTFGFLPDGGTLWQTSSPGTVAASPLLTSDGKVIVGGFDGYVHAYDSNTGHPLWRTATRDHIYSSAAKLPDGTIVVPSTDGTIYALDPDTGGIVWQYDTTEPIRSSPAVDCEGNVYVGTGDGQLLVLTSEGKLRWSIKLIDADRENLNSSPALGETAIYLGGESGEVFSVPYDYCLAPEGAADSRCVTTAPAAPSDGATLVLTSPFGHREPVTPDAFDGTWPLVFSLVVTKGGVETLAILDSASISVTTDPPQTVATEVSGDGKFVTISPETAFTAGADGRITITVSDGYYTDLSRVGLKESVATGATIAGTASGSASFTVNGGDSTTISSSDGWILTRLAIPLPSIMPSYNQIGFDQLVYALSFPLLYGSPATTGVGWMVGGIETADGGFAVDPTTQAIIPFNTTLAGGLVAAANLDGLTVNVMNLDLPFAEFSIASRLTNDAGSTGTAVFTGTANCGDIEMYGAFMETLGMCNPQTDAIDFYGAANVLPFAQPAMTDTVGAATFSAAGGAATVSLTGSTLSPADHLIALLLVNPDAGTPISLNYGTETVRTTNGDGTLATVSIPLGDAGLPPTMEGVLMVDLTAVATGTVTLP